MKSISHYIKRPSSLVYALTRLFAPIIPDKLYLSIIFRCKMGSWISWNSPLTFNEKIQWLKLYNRKPEFTKMVDKYAVKDYVAEKIGSQYIIPTLGIWDSFDQINFDELPDKFVLKTTHGGGGGGIAICHDKNTFDKQLAKQKLEQSLRSDIYRNYREWPYKNVTRRIIAEQLIETPESTDIKDYKFFCFNGEPHFLKVDFDRFVDHHANYYDMEWRLLPFGEADFPPVPQHKETCPPNFDIMVELVKKLSVDQPFIRVDLFNINGKIYFGELTFYPASGMGKFTSRKADFEIGNLLQLP